MTVHSYTMCRCQSQDWSRGFLAQRPMPKLPRCLWGQERNGQMMAPTLDAVSMGTDFTCGLSLIHSTKLYCCCLCTRPFAGAGNAGMTLSLCPRGTPKEDSPHDGGTYGKGTCHTLHKSGRGITTSLVWRAPVTLDLGLEG